MGDYNESIRLKYEQTCKDCGASDFVEDHASGDLICRNCGAVNESRLIDEGSEWRTFSEKDKDGADPNRVGGPVNALLSDGGLSTMIGTSNKGGDKALVANLSRVQARTEASGDRALVAAFREIDRIANAMKLPEAVKQQAKAYYKEALDGTKWVKGRAQPAVHGAVIFMACRQAGCPRFYRDITPHVPASNRKDIGKACKAITRELRLKERGHFLPEAHSNRPELHLRRFMSSLGMSNADMNAGIALAKAMMPDQGPAADVHAQWHGKSPASIAASVIFIVSCLPRASAHPPLADVCAACGVADGTILAIYREVHPHLKTLVKQAGGFATDQEIEQLPPPPEGKGGRH